MSGPAWVSNGWWRDARFRGLIVCADSREHRISAATPCSRATSSFRQRAGMSPLFSDIDYAEFHVLTQRLGRLWISRSRFMSTSRTSRSHMVRPEVADSTSVIRPRPAMPLSSSKPSSARRRNNGVTLDGVVQAVTQQALDSLARLRSSDTQTVSRPALFLEKRFPAFGVRLPLSSRSRVGRVLPSASPPKLPD